MLSRTPVARYGVGVDRSLPSGGQGDVLQVPEVGAHACDEEGKDGDGELDGVAVLHRIQFGESAVR